MLVAGESPNRTNCGLTYFRPPTTNNAFLVRFAEPHLHPTHLPPPIRPADGLAPGRMGETLGGLAVDGWIVADDKTRHRTHPGALTVSFGNGTAWRCFL